MTPYDLGRSEIQRRDTEDHAAAVIAIVLCTALGFLLGWAAHVLFRVLVP